MEIKEQLDKVKDGLEKKKKRDSFKDIHIPFSLIEDLSNKLDTIQEGAEKNETPENIYKKLKELKIVADTLQGLEPKDFSLITHEHNDLLHNKTFYAFEKDIKRDTDKLVGNIQDIYYEMKEHKHEEIPSLSKKISEIKGVVGKIKENITLFTNDHSKLKNLPWSKSGHIMDSDLDMQNNKIVNVKEPKKPSDVATKGYADSVAQRAANMGTIGGGGVYVGKTAPPNPNINALWVQI